MSPENNERRALAIFTDGEPEAAGTENVAGVKRFDLEFRRDFEASAALNRRELLQHWLDVSRCVEWLSIGVVLALRIPLGALSIFFLQMAGIFQRKRREFNCRRIGVDFRFVAVARQAGKPAR